MIELRRHVYKFPLMEWNKKWKPLLKYYFQNLHSFNWQQPQIITSRGNKYFVYIILENCPVGIATYYSFPIYNIKPTRTLTFDDKILQQGVQQIMKRVDLLITQAERHCINTKCSQSNHHQIHDQFDWNSSQLDLIFQQLSTQLNIVRACRMPLHQPEEETECY
jgi:hypothetical protein